MDPGRLKPVPVRVRKLAFSALLYRYGNLVWRFFSKLKHFRAVATRVEKHEANDLAAIKLASAGCGLEGGDLAVERQEVIPRHW